MANYTKTTNFTAKDSLPSGNAAKKILGSLFDTEFNNISTAIASKANLADPTFTGTVNLASLTTSGVVTVGNNIVSDTDSTDSLGSTSVRWAKVWTDDLTSGTITVTSGSITDSSGAISFGNENLTTTGNASVVNATASGLITAGSLTLASGATVTAILDEDAMGSNSATAVPTQQSTKAYVDATVVDIGALTISGTPVTNDFSRFTDGNTLEGRSYAEARADLSLEVGTDVQAYDADTAKLDVVQTFSAVQTFVGPVLGTPASGVATNLTGTATGLTSGITNALKSDTTTVNVSAGSAPTTGQILTATGATAATWQDSAAGGAWTYLSTVTAVSAATADIETTLDDTYDTYKIIVTEITGSGQLRARWKAGGSYRTGANDYAYRNDEKLSSSSGTTVTFDATEAFIAMSGGSFMNSSMNEYEITISNPAISTKQKSMRWEGLQSLTTQTREHSGAGGYTGGTSGSGGSAITGIRLYLNGVNISLVARLYGIKNS